MKSIFSFLTIFLFILTIQGQETPTDFLSSDFHKGRREAVRKMMPVNSVAVFFANPVRNRANDVDYIYHQDPDFYYLTGYREPNSVLVIFSENQKNSAGKEFNEMVYVQQRDPRAEQWNGKRLGVEGVKSQLGFEMAFNGSEFATSDTDFKSFDKILFYDFKNDYRDTRDTADLFDLIKTFKVKVDYPSGYDEAKNQAPQEKEVKDKLNTKVVPNNLDSRSLSRIMSTLREVKTAEEMVLLKKAIEISAVGQIEIMKAMHPGMSETEIQGVHEFVYKKYGAEYEGYPSIVGGGNNGCILHYIENNKPKVGEDLVLMDLGAEYHGYTADVTRTIPANGKFSKEQKAIYDIVYNAQEAGIEASVVGAPFRAPGRAAFQIVAEGLLKLGIISEIGETRKYFPHGTSHYLGLDVHDKGTGGDFKENTVITVEPGIYIPEGSDCDKKWWGIAVRIEDDILITQDGPVNLSGMAPRTTEAIEAMMKKTSPLENLELPQLD